MLAPCPTCHNQLNFDATPPGQVVACPYCGQQIINTVYQPVEQGIVTSGRRRRRGPQSHPGAAALLSFVIPGAGQMYAGSVIMGLCFFMLWSFFMALALVTVGLALIPAFGVQVLSMLLAYAQANASQRD